MGWLSRRSRAQRVPFSKGCTCATELWIVLFAQRIVIEVALAGGIGQGQRKQERGEGMSCVQCRHTSLGAHLATNQDS